LSKLKQQPVHSATMPRWANGRRNPIRRRRWPPLLLWLVATAAVAIIVYLAGPADPPAGDTPLVGRARIVDGDTLALGSTRIRLADIDAPERSQTCGEATNPWSCGATAEARLAELARTQVSCQPEDRDRWGRIVAVCRSGDADIGAAMVRDGLALSTGRYGAIEAEARQAGRGIWAGPFVAPAQWRKLTGGEPDQSPGPSRFEVIFEWLSGLFQR
jgi:endonuclease YncB( thermonuclease family)